MKRKKIEVTRNGPYIVTGNVPVKRGNMVPDEAGVPYEWTYGPALESEEETYLCRCGRSGNKPFCDDTHLTWDFDGTETAGDSKFNEQATKIEGPTLILEDVRSLCASARFCLRAGGVANFVRNSDDPAAREAAIQEVKNCTSGRLVLIDRSSGQPIEDTDQPGIIVVEDPGKMVSGPLFVKGAFQVVSADGKEYEVRNRVTLCRCGHSSNKPFCDGSHIRAGFRDENSG